MQRALARALARLASSLPTLMTPNMCTSHPRSFAAIAGLARPRAGVPPCIGATSRPRSPLLVARAAASSTPKPKPAYECADCGLQLAQKKGCCPECGAWGR